MGGPGSGRWREGAVRPPQRISHDTRRQRAYQIAVYAAQHGVRAAMAEFDVSENTTRKALWRNKMYPARDAPPKIGTSAIRILKRMLVDKEPVDVAAVAVGVTRTYARAVWREAEAAGFIFQEIQCDTGHDTDAEKPDGGERGEGFVVG